MTDTKHKLEEAEYFFMGMKSNIEVDKIFSFNLSAFLTSARSVTYIMQKEFNHVKEFGRWYITKKEVISSDADFKFFNDMRVATVHTNPIMPNKKVSISIIEPAISVTDSVAIKVIRAGKVVQDTPNTIEKVLKPFKSIQSQIRSILAAFNPYKKYKMYKGQRNISRFFKERPNDDLIELCEKYLQKLRELVDECELKHHL
jgi:hypothetical protein